MGKRKEKGGIWIGLGERTDVTVEE